MARNGSGTYSRAVSAYVYNTVIDQAAVNSEMDDIATALTGSLAKDGQTVPTANIPLGGYRLTGVGAATATTDALTAATIPGLTDKATPVDADLFPLVDSAASNVLKKLTWANVKAVMFAAIGVLTAAGTDKATPVDADVLPLGDSAASNATKKLTWANLKATAKTYFDTLYAAKGVATASGLTMTTARLLGRTTASTGAVEEISVAGSLTLSGGVLTGGGITLGTQQAASGTAITFGSIPAGTKRITVMFDEVSTNTGATAVLLRLGDSGGIEATGYVSYTQATSATDGFLVSDEASAADKRSGIVTLCLMNAATFKWVMAGTIGASNVPAGDSIGGVKSLSAELTQISITTSAGTATFDNGNINISYE